MARTTATPKRPVEYSEELALEICDTVSCTPDMLEEICEKRSHWPCAQTVYKWRLRYPPFGEMYAKAKQSQIEALVSHAFNLCRSKKDAYLHDKDGIPFADNVDICNKRHQIDLIKWLAAKLAPKIYGDKNVNANVTDSEDFISKNRDKL